MKRIGWENMSDGFYHAEIEPWGWNAWVTRDDKTGKWCFRVWIGDAHCDSRWDYGKPKTAKDACRKWLKKLLADCAGGDS